MTPVASSVSPIAADLSAPPPARGRRGFLLWLAAITAVGAVLRLRHLGIQILGDDELHVLAAVTTRSLGELPSTVRETDFSIPLALLYRAWALWRPLDEWTLRAPMLLCGILTPALAAGMARRFVSRRVALALAMLIAVHPLFIFYSRFVRPYAVCLVLVLGALWLLDRWVTERRRGACLGAAVCSALACWFQPLAVIAVALLFLGALLHEGLARRAVRDEAATKGRPWALAAAAGLTLVLGLALYGPALPGVFEKFVVGKVGAGTLDLAAVRRNAVVLAGLPGLLPALVLAALVLAGCGLLVRRLGSRSLLLLLPALGQPLVILAIQPEGVQGSLVLARYQFYVLPLWLLAASLALAAIACRVAGALARLSRGSRDGALPARVAACGPIAAALLAGAFWLLGPYREIYTADNAYAHHIAFQTLEYADDPHWRAARARAPDAPVHAFYKGLASPAQAVPLVVEWPAPVDDPHDYLYLDQAFHRVPMKLLSTPGEIWFTSPLLALRNVVTLREGEASPFAPGTLVVLHANPSSEAALYVYGHPLWLPAGRHHEKAFEALSEALRARLGEPVFADRFLTVYRQPAG